MTPEQLIEGLSDPGAYPVAVDRVEIRQTHVSILFFAGPRVYKVKKPVDLGFLDFTTLQRRRHFCEEEVRLNRRLAGEVYLGVAGVARVPGGGLRIVGADDGSIIEYAVEMIRLPEQRMLDRLLDDGLIDNAILDDLVKILLRFHREAATGEGVDEHGTPEAVGRAVRENLSEARRFVAPEPERGMLSPALWQRLSGAAESFLADHESLLAQRIRDGRIRDGHGDLHAGNICAMDDRIVIYDCIEFAPHLRCGDVVKDLAFLVMDLDARGARGLRGFGRYLARRYAEGSADADLETLLPFYKGHLAAVRGKVNSIAADDPGLDQAQRDDARREAMRYFHLAGSYLLPPALIVMCGLPGSGKSWAARHLARPFEAAVIQSDVVRKRLAGVAPTHRPTPEEAAVLYAPPSSRRTYETMLREAGTLLEEGRSVVVDATFPHRDAREPFSAMARARATPWVVVHITSPETVIAERMRRRADLAEEVSDADWTVYRQFKTGFEPPDEVGSSHLTEGDSTGDPEVIVSNVIDRLLEQTG